MKSILGSPWHLRGPRQSPTFALWVSPALLRATVYIRTHVCKKCPVPGPTAEQGARVQGLGTRQPWRSRGFRRLWRDLLRGCGSSPRPGLSDWSLTRRSGGLQGQGDRREGFQAMESRAGDFDSWLRLSVCLSVYLSIYLTVCAMHSFNLISLWKKHFAFGELAKLNWQSESATGNNY